MKLKILFVEGFLVYIIMNSIFLTDVLKYYGFNFSQIYMEVEKQIFKDLIYLYYMDKWVTPWGLHSCPKVMNFTIQVESFIDNITMYFVFLKCVWEQRRRFSRILYTFTIWPYQPNPRARTRDPGAMHFTLLGFMDMITAVHLIFPHMCGNRVYEKVFENMTFFVYLATHMAPQGQQSHEFHNFDSTYNRDASHQKQ